jgi:predicted ATPase/class 3 adenylate cyclase
MHASAEGEPFRTLPDVPTVLSEIRALLLTDVVDSTRLSETIGDAATAELWTAHDRLARDLLQRHGGREIDKTDGMLMLFESAADAVQFTLAYHRAIEALPVPLRARAGLHVGTVILRENAAEDVARGAKPLEVDGLAKPTAARVMSLARGGQTLLTGDARRALGAGAPRLHAHGHWALKGLAEPIELYSVDTPGDPPTAPPDGDKGHRVARVGERWLPTAELPNNLPQPSTSFIGRNRELDEIRAQLGRSRLVTLLGMGGLGKTRLSLQVAAELMAEHPDGTWFLDLAPIRDPALVVGEAAQVLGLREEPDRPLIQTVCAHLKPLRVLLVFDNCEHLIGPSAELAHAILRAAPQVRVLASSRELLGVPGEQAYPVQPLPVPKRGDDLGAVERSTAVQLFVERARLHKPGFTLSEREAPAVVELVARLEGIPLALELAAARLRSLSVADINARLKDRYKVLTGGARVLQLRQQTLRALVDWSYELLNEAERIVLDRLGAFAGGFALDGAEKVCGAEPVDPDDVLDLLASLVQKSLVMMDDTEEVTRYRLLDTISDYARERLKEKGEAQITAARHCGHYFAMAKEASAGLQGPHQAEWIQRVETELDNMRAAMSLALAGGVDAFIAVKFAVAMQAFWTLRGYCTEGRAMVRAALALPAVQASDLAHAWGLYVGAALAEMQSDYAEARRMLETCLALRRGLGNPVEIAATLSTLSLARLQEGEVAGAESGEREALEIFRGLGDKVGEAIGHLHLGQIAMFREDDAHAAQSLERALALSRELRHQEIEGECELLLGQIAVQAGQLAQAELQLKRSFTVCREAGDRHGEANAQRWLGRLDVERRDAPSARRRLDEALGTFRAFEMREELLGALEDHAALAVLEGQPEKGVRLGAAASVLRERLRLQRPPRAERRWQEQLAALRAALPGEAFDEAWSSGGALEVDQALRAALATRGETVTA